MRSHEHSGGAFAPRMSRGGPACRPGARSRGRVGRAWAAAWILALAGSSCARSDEQWIDDLAHPDPFVRALSAIALAEQAPARASLALPVLLETVDRAELGLQRVSALELERIAPGVVDELLEHLARDEFMTTDRRAAVIEALIAAGPVAVPALVAALRGPARAQAGELGLVLVRIGQPSVGALIELLSERSDPELRAHAAWLLGRLGPRADQALPALRSARLDPDASVGRAAEQALSAIESAAGAALRGPRPNGRLDR